MLSSFRYFARLIFPRAEKTGPKLSERDFCTARDSLFRELRYGADNICIAENGEPLGQILFEQASHNDVGKRESTAERILFVTLASPPDDSPNPIPAAYCKEFLRIHVLPPYKGNPQFKCERYIDSLGQMGNIWLPVGGDILSLDWTLDHIRGFCHNMKFVEPSDLLNVPAPATAPASAAPA